jgi:putative Mg2+ transporter-C (MgtC) family protein
MPETTITTTDLLLRLLMATAIGGLIGIEREFHGRPAGLRTHILVCLAACILMSGAEMFQALYSVEGAESVYRIDPGRVAAGVVTGIGFLGAGAIIRSHDIIRGLTTAACIWFVAALGIIAGYGLFLPAGVAAVTGFLVLTLLDPITRGIPQVHYDTLHITSEKGTAEDIENGCRGILASYPIIVQNTEIHADRTTGERRLVLYVRVKGVKNKHEVVKKLLDHPGVLKVSWE